MKKIYSLFILGTILSLLGLQTGSAQVSNTTKIGTMKTAPLAKGIIPIYSQMTNDTMVPPVFMSPCFLNDPSPYVYYKLSPASGNSGYLTGNNDLGMGAIGVEVAQRYSFSGTGTISDVLISYAHTAGTTGLTASNVYDIDPTYATPLNILGASNTIPTGSLSTTSYTDYTFSPAIPLSADFAVSSVLPEASTGDTAVVTSTKITCHSNDSLSSLSLGTYGWFPYTLIINLSAPPDSNIDLLILPIVDVPTGITDYPTSKGLSLLGAYPNPAQSFTNISYRVDKPAAVTISVFDINGKVYKNYSENLVAGTHQLNVNVKDLAAGTYFYTIRTENAVMTSKFSVVR